MSRTSSLLMSRAEGRGMMDARELLALCRKAAIVAVRPPYGPDDRAECVADIYGDIVAEVSHDARRKAARNQGRDGMDGQRDMLRWIDRAMSSDSVRQSAAMPRRTDARVQFVALRNRAHDWRRTRDHQRDRDAMKSGAKSGRSKPITSADDRPPARYIAAGAAQNRAAARRAAGTACDLLGLPTGRTETVNVRRTAMITEELEVHVPSDHVCIFYGWAREADGETCARELGLTHEAYRKRTSRAAADIRTRMGAAQLLATLCGDALPVLAPEDRAAIEGAKAVGVLAYIGAALDAAPLRWDFSLTDASREAHGRTPILAKDPRDGTAAGEWPVRPLDAHLAREACRVSHRRPAPRRAAQNRADALDGRTPEEAEAEARLSLGRALSRDGQAHAGTGLVAVSLGRTSGKAPERYAARTVRLGRK